MNIYQKMSAITQEIATVAKNLMVGDGRNQYKAVSEADVLSAVKPVEAKHGIYSYPVSRKVIDSGEMVSVKEYNGNKTETRRLYLRVETTYRFVNMDDPAEQIEIVTYGDGVDTQDKAPGKAMTYSDKYALLKAYKIQTGDDPDAQASEPLKGITHKRVESETRKPVENEKIDAVKVSALKKMVIDDQVNVPNLLKLYKVKSFEELTEKQHKNMIDNWNIIKTTYGSNGKN